MAKNEFLESFEFSSSQWSLIEIINPYLEHQLAYQINTIFNIDLTREPDFDFCVGENTELFSVFSHADEDMKRFYVLLSTHSQNEVPVWKGFDSAYTKLFFILGNNHHETAKLFVDTVFSIPNTIFAQHFNFEENPNPLKKKATALEKRKQQLEKLLNEELLEALELHFVKHSPREEDPIVLKQKKFTNPKAN